MKKMNYFLLAMLFIISATLTSCSKDDDHDCHECHIALDNGDGTETAWDITNAAGGEDFCGSELSTVEDPAYEHTITEALVSDSGDTLQAGTYGASNGYEIHCEEHGDHHDH
tara:strand:+ start:536 stop:871 length:336 start_codon:yes stop_codon:yes gene_type:complete